MPSHHYRLTVEWTGNLGTGTSAYRSYSRAMDIGKDGAPVIAGSSDPAFRGDATRYNPEELLVASLSGCHMLWYLHLCADAGIVVTHYRDEPEGTMTERKDGGGEFDEVVLRPVVTLASAPDEGRARALHERAHALCYIASSVRFPVRVEGGFESAGAA